MTRILVVDDSEVDRRIVTGLLSRSQPECQLETAANGREALDRLRASPPDVIVTDMQMPERDGLELVRAVRLHFPQVPVILVTGQGSDDLAILALEEGAASYVPKSQLADRLAETVEEVLAISRADRTYERLIGCLQRTELDFTLDNDPALIDPLVDLIQQMAAGMGLCDVNDRFRIGVALKAALLNALYRGNLELSAAQLGSARDAELRGPARELVQQRRQASPFRDRSIQVRVRITPDEAQFSIRDQGPGFPVEATLASIPASSLDPHTGRGIVLMRAFMDEVHYNPRGNEVVLSKRHSPRSGTS